MPYSDWNLEAAIEEQTLKLMSKHKGVQKMSNEVQTQIQFKVTSLMTRHCEELAPYYGKIVTCNIIAISPGIDMHQRILSGEI